MTQYAVKAGFTCAWNSLGNRLFTFGCNSAGSAAAAACSVAAATTGAGNTVPARRGVPRASERSPRSMRGAGGAPQVGPTTAVSLRPAVVAARHVGFCLCAATACRGGRGRCVRGCWASCEHADMARARHGSCTCVPSVSVWRHLARSSPVSLCERVVAVLGAARVRGIGRGAADASGPVGESIQ